VRFETSQGPFVVAVHRDWAPLGAARFYALVRHGYFDEQRFFRVRAGFIAQFGLHGDPSVIALWKGRVLADDSARVTNRRGTLAYAFTTAGTRGTQIFINLADNASLDAQGFAPFGEIVEGLAVVDRLYAGYDESAGGGMRGGRQGKIEAEGNAHLRRDFPKLDYIRRARLIGGEDRAGRSGGRGAR
jgi:cyclophilin family peptidyl-prolyl cis-trans isomerase